MKRKCCHCLIEKTLNKKNFQAVKTFKNGFSFLCLECDEMTKKPKPERKGEKSLKTAEFKPLPDSQRLRIMQQVAVTSAIEGQGQVYDIFAQLLYNYLTDKKLGVTLCDETQV